MKNKKHALDSLGWKALPVAFHSSKKEKVPIAILRIGKPPKVAPAPQPVAALPTVEPALVNRRSVYSRNFAIIQLMKKRQMKDQWFQSKLSAASEPPVPLELKLEYS